MLLLPASLSIAKLRRRPAPTTAPAVATTHNNNAGHITTQPGGGLLINFKDVSIDSVLDELSSVAGFIVVKVDNPVGRVTMVSKQPVTAADAVPLLNTVLKNIRQRLCRDSAGANSQNHVARPRKTSNIPVHTGSDPAKIEPTDELITQVIPLRSVDAMQLKNDLAPLVDPAAGFTANASSNSLVITDTSANIRRIAEIVNAMDESQAGAAEVKVFQLQYASASGAAKLINDLFGDQSAPTATAVGGGFAASAFFGGPGFGGFGEEETEDAAIGAAAAAIKTASPVNRSKPMLPRTIARTPSSSSGRPTL